jgi:hypothetical protein
MCFVLLAWSVISTVSSLHHHITPVIRSSSLRIATFLLPSVYSALPYILEALAPGSSSHAPLTVAASSVIAALALFRIPDGLPLLVCIPLSALRFVEGRWPSTADWYLLGCFVFVALLALAVHTYPAAGSRTPPAVRGEDIPDAAPRWPWNMLSLTLQDLFCCVFFVGGFLFMTYTNAFAATRMPIANALPDVLHSAFPVADALRNRSSGALQLSNVGCLVSGGQLTVAWICRPRNLNVRRLSFVWGAMVILRSVAFSLTALPAPCAGLANCPCARPETIQLLASTAPIKIAIRWLVGVGVWMTYPQCGDLIVSGHTIFQWVGFRTLREFFVVAMPQPFARLAIFVNAALIAGSLAHIIIARNHYGVDVFLAWILTEMAWLMYGLAAEIAKRPPQKSEKGVVKFVRWIETRQFPLETGRDSSDDGV